MLLMTASRVVNESTMFRPNTKPMSSLTLPASTGATPKMPELKLLATVLVPPVTAMKTSPTIHPFSKKSLASLPRKRGEVAEKTSI
jgi:hypothetical protein